jgi:hypothetical protein
LKMLYDVPKMFLENYYPPLCFFLSTMIIKNKNKNKK